MLIPAMPVMPVTLARVVVALAPVEAAQPVVIGADAGAVGGDEVVAVARADPMRPHRRTVRVVPELPLLLPRKVMETNPATRVDKWLWAVRLFRTRAAAAAACNGGKVTINGATIKPARLVRTGDIIAANNGTLTRTIKVIGLLDKRVGAPLVQKYLEDLTPAAEYEAARQREKETRGRRTPGSGRPTKRDRRILQSFFGHEE
ncbi:MAG TPA: S4 domain-containing protein [Verrucomicrobiae bacterium]|nr:S4 domain-containing protein [Verrucomicrobiae bacterium]